MLPITSILFPTDFSPTAEHAFEVACALARDYEAKLTILHVKPPPPPMISEVVIPPLEDPNEMKLLTEKLNQVRPANPFIRAEHVMVEGDPASEIARVAEKTDLIVMGTHGRTGFSRMLMGSVAEAVQRQSARPVLTRQGPRSRE